MSKNTCIKKSTIVKEKTTTRRDFMRAMGLGAAAMALPGRATITQGATSKKGKGKPNIILVLTDDQGWTDTSVQMMAGRADTKSDFYQTPNLERMAKEGMVFSSGYAPAPQCAPTRGSIQFGKTPARLKQTTNGKPTTGIDRKNEVSIPQMIRSADSNYVTAHFGKWMVSLLSPEQAGYDESDGPTGNGQGNLDDNKKPLPEDDPKRIFSVTERANNFIEQQVKAGRPFFMQVSHYAVHVGHHALKETIEKYRKLSVNLKNKAGKTNDATILYAAMVENLDTGLGMLLDKVKELGIKDNTYIIFTSDNGGAFGDNAPLKGKKRDLWEGGIRVPTVICGPNVLKGSYCDVPIAGWDFLPTFSDLIGNQKPLPKDLDGGSLKDLFEKGNKGTVKRGTKELIFQCLLTTLPMSTIRDGDYKLVMNLVTKEIRLYNLADDIGETNDLVKKMPEKTGQLHKRLLDYLKQVDAEDIHDMFAARRKQVNEQIKREMASPEPNEEKLKRYRINLANVDKAERNREW